MTFVVFQVPLVLGPYVYLTRVVALYARVRMKQPMYPICLNENRLSYQLTTKAKQSVRDHLVKTGVGDNKIKYCKMS